MGKLEQYRHIIRQLMLSYESRKPAYGEIDVQVILDAERDHYQVMHVGWNQERWVHSCVIHIDIKAGKVWLQWNSTEDDIAAILAERGIAKEDIVLGFQPPFMRQFTEYAVG